jgi:CelD/BcsL family acetyltransferase involved in cellulose biosynthesis
MGNVRRNSSNADAALNGADTKLTCRPISEMSREIRTQWRNLHLDSLSPNIFLSPDFVLTALSTINPEDPLAICVSQGNELIGLAILQENERSLAFPLRSMRQFATIHSCQTGVLLRKDITNEALDTFVRAVMEHGKSKIYFRDFDMSSQTALRLVESAKRQNYHWYDVKSYARPTLEPGTSLDDWQMQRRKMLKEIRRQRRRLAEQGELTWQILMPEDVTDDTIEVFLALENDGWKGERSTSLLSQDTEAEFFRQLVKKLIETGEIFFTELRLNNEAIASTVNFMSGNVAFAFKVGWKKQFARYSPGNLNEIFFVEYACSNNLPFTFIESGTNDVSFIDRLWPGRISMFNGFLIRGGIPRLTAVALRWARRLKMAIAKGSN